MDLIAYFNQDVGFAMSVSTILPIVVIPALFRHQYQKISIVSKSNIDARRLNIYKIFMRH